MSIQLEKDIFISGRHTPMRSRQGSGKGKTYNKSDTKAHGSGSSQKGVSRVKTSGTPGRNEQYWEREHQYDRHNHCEQDSEQVLRVVDYHTNLSHHLTTSMDNNLVRKSVTFNSNKYPKDNGGGGSSSPHHRSKDANGGVRRNGAAQQTSLIQNIANSVAMNGGSVNGEVFERTHDYSNFNAQKKGSSSQRMKPKRVEETQWYTRPIHLGAKEVNNNSLPTRSISPINRSEAPIGVGSPTASKLDSSTENSELHNASSKDLDTTNNTSNTSIDHALARQYFPVTLGASYEVGKPLSPSENGTNSSGGSLSPPGKGLPISQPRAKSPGRSKRPSSGHSSTSSRSRSRKSRPSSAQSSSSSASKSSLDRMYMMSVETPTIGFSTLLLSSPYQSELARLRMERLRIEEAHLLEVKREDELERIRGPAPKWYELKSPQFHYEAHKNNSLLSSQEEWQHLLDYRTELETASKQFQNAYSANGST